MRASKKHNKRLGFVTIPQRLNVALTRAKESLFVCGHFDTLRTDETWKDMIEDATQRSLTHNVTSVFEISSLRPLLIKKWLNNFIVLYHLILIYSILLKVLRRDDNFPSVTTRSLVTTTTYLNTNTKKLLTHYYHDSFVSLKLW